MVVLRLHVYSEVTTGYLDVDIPEEWSCGQIMKHLLECEGQIFAATNYNDICGRNSVTSTRSCDWYLAEKWQGYERVLSRDEKPVQLLDEWGLSRNDVQLVVRPCGFQRKVSFSAPKFWIRADVQQRSFSKLTDSDQKAVDDRQLASLSRQGRWLSALRHSVQTHLQSLSMLEKRDEVKELGHQQQASEAEDLKTLRKEVTEQRKLLASLQQVLDIAKKRKQENSVKANLLKQLRQKSIFVHKKLQHTQEHIKVLNQKLEQLPDNGDKNQKGTETESVLHGKQEELKQLAQELQLREIIHEQQDKKLRKLKDDLREKVQELNQLEDQVNRLTEQLSFTVTPAQENVFSAVQSVMGLEKSGFSSIVGNTKLHNAKSTFEPGKETKLCKTNEHADTPEAVLKLLEPSVVPIPKESLRVPLRRRGSLSMTSSSVHYRHPLDLSRSISDAGVGLFNYSACNNVRSSNLDTSVSTLIGELQEMLPHDAVGAKKSNSEATEIDNQQEDSSLQRNKHPSPSILPKEQHQDLFEQKTVNKWLRGHRSASRLKGAHGVNSFWKGQRDKRGVSFEPLALLLNAALEGELDLVKECIEKVEDSSKCNEYGVTALHNAVCSERKEVVSYLIDVGCEVNASEVEGWTPLHLAAASLNLEIIRILIQNGASVFATTADGDSPLDVAVDELSEDDFEQGVDNDCIKAIREAQVHLGTRKSGRVFALYNYNAMSDDELNFQVNEELTVVRRGDDLEDEWWWVANKQGIEGYAPRNYLALYPRRFKCV
ncbi:uncharacterized protein LOC134189024 isoform X2 [Corticium candelabrum]|uniref:uncharacterized protein LOC134189024 isoform X2 n=1 Tax=Corticium candelabrum TaxID=121492 RepID=UPI002E259029|nr:uncharacterized protein LOC134189024 isoform X2 [Corticium candelabrum]